MNHEPARHVQAVLARSKAASDEARALEELVRDRERALEVLHAFAELFEALPTAMQERAREDLRRRPYSDEFETVALIGTRCLTTKPLLLAHNIYTTRDGVLEKYGRKP